jgi:hypothetical protein
MGGACGTNGRENNCIHNIDGKTCVIDRCEVMAANVW